MHALLAALLAVLSGAAVLGLHAEMGTMDGVMMLNEDAELEAGIEFHPPSAGRGKVVRDIAALHAQVSSNRAHTEAVHRRAEEAADNMELGESAEQAPATPPLATGDTNATAPASNATVDPALNGDPEEPDTKVAKAKKLDDDGRKQLKESEKFKELAEKKLAKVADMEGKDPPKPKSKPEPAPASTDENCKDTPGLKCKEKTHLCESPAFGKEIREQCRLTCGECTGSLAVPDKPAGAQWVVKAVKREAQKAVKDAVAKATDEIKQLIKDKLKPPEPAPAPPPVADMSVEDATKKIMSLIEDKMKAHPEAMKVVKAAVNSVTPPPTAAPMASVQPAAAAAPGLAATYTSTAATPAPVAATPSPMVTPATTPPPTTPVTTEMAASDGDGDGDGEEPTETAADEDDEADESGDGDNGEWY